MNDDWRLKVHFSTEEQGIHLARTMDELGVEHDVELALGKRVIVSRDDDVLFFYTDSSDHVKQIENVISALMKKEGIEAEIAVNRWHPVEEAWEDAKVPMPSSESEIEGERKKHEQREIEESRKTGYPEWEVRLELPNHLYAFDLSEKLADEGIEITRSSKYLIAGANSEEQAEKLAERLKQEAPEAVAVTVEGTGSAAWNYRPSNPFAIFGGLGG